MNKATRTINRSSGNTCMFTFEQQLSIPHCRGYGVTSRLSYIARSAVCGKELMYYNDMSKAQRSAVREFIDKVLAIYEETSNKEIWKISDE